MTKAKTATQEIILNYSDRIKEIIIENNVNTPLELEESVCSILLNSIDESNAWDSDLLEIIINDFVLKVNWEDLLKKYKGE